MKTIYILAAIIIGIVGLKYFENNFTVKPSEREIIGPACAKWISEEFNDNRETRAVDGWRKKGKFVFSIAASQEGTTTEDMYLCVYDPKTQQLLKPSVFSYRDWSR